MKSTCSGVQLFYPLLMGRQVYYPSKMIRVGLIGYGYWGPHLLRNFLDNKHFQVTMVADLRASARTLIKTRFPELRVTDTAQAVFSSKEIDAVAIATPVSTHYELAKTALEHDKHVLVEKPLTDASEKARSLINLAKRKKKVLMVDHTFLYTPAVAMVARILGQKKLGKIRYFDSVRTNLGIIRNDVNVLWDLAAHDISILMHLHKELPTRVYAVGGVSRISGMESVANLTLKYPSGVIAHFNCSWNSPVKLRTITIGGERRMILYNDIEPTEKIRIYDSRISVRKSKLDHDYRIDYRVGDVHIPKIELREALASMVEDFARAIKKGVKPVSDGVLGFRVVKILEASDKSLKSGNVIHLRPQDFA